MIQNSKVITENEFMQKRKIILLRAVATLKRLGGNESLIEELVEKQGETMKPCLTDSLKNLPNCKADIGRNRLPIAVYKK